MMPGLSLATMVAEIRDSDNLTVGIKQDLFGGDLQMQQALAMDVLKPCRDLSRDIDDLLDTQFATSGEHLCQRFARHQLLMAKK
jgi:hypothetical protein